MRYTRFLCVVGLVCIVFGFSFMGYGQITPSQDAYTDSSKATTNFGGAVTMGVANTAASIQSAYMQFDLSSIPAGYTSANVAKATLKLYVGTVAAAGSFNVDYVTGSWTERTITANLAPALGGTIQGSVPLTTGNANTYLLIDVTVALQAWLNGAQPNDGIALVANSPLSASFNSKENAGQSHPPELDVVFNGAITAVNTAAGSGLTGGGTSGALNLSLLKTCSTGQTLNWNGSAWVCKTISGSGTVTSVGLSAPTSDFVVSGSPITKSGTLNIAWTVPPDSKNTNNAIVKRDSTGSFQTNNITAVGQITVNNATSLNPISSNASAANAAAITGYSKGAGLTDGVLGSTVSSGRGSSGVIGIDQNSNGLLGNYTAGVTGVTENAYGAGVLGYGVFSTNGQNDIGFYRAGVWGDDISGVGVVATSDTGYGMVANNTSATNAAVVALNNSTGNGLLAINASTDHPTVFAQNNGDGTAAMAYNTSATGMTLKATNNTTSSTGIIFRAEAPQVLVNGSSAFCQVNTSGTLGCTGDVYQNSPANGLVKALLYFDPFQPLGSQVVNCFNSSLAEPAASAPPCGFTVAHTLLGLYQVDFGFTVNNRFVQITAAEAYPDVGPVVAAVDHYRSSTATQVNVETFYVNAARQYTDTPFYLSIF